MNGRASEYELYGATWLQGDGTIWIPQIAGSRVALVAHDFHLQNVWITMITQVVVRLSVVVFTFYTLGFSGICQLLPIEIGPVLDTWTVRC